MMNLKFYGTSKGGILKANNVKELSKFLFKSVRMSTEVLKAFSGMEDRFDLLMAFWLYQSFDPGWLEEEGLSIISNMAGLDTFYVVLFDVGEVTQVWSVTSSIGPATVRNGEEAKAFFKEHPVFK
jgi:hypothetical protein